MNHPVWHFVARRPYFDILNFSHDIATTELFLAWDVFSETFFRRRFFGDVFLETFLPMFLAVSSISYGAAETHTARAYAAFMGDAS